MRSSATPMTTRMCACCTVVTATCHGDGHCLLFVLMQDDDGEGEEDDGEDEDDDGEDDDGEEDDGEDERHSRLLQTVQSAIADPRGRVKAKASATVVVGSASNESQFSSTLPGTLSAGALDASALLSHVTEPKSSLHRLKRKVAALATATGGISAPIAAAAAQRIARAAAFDDSKKTVDKWQEIVKKNREAETLSFPLNQPGQANLSNAALVDGFKPANDMENEIRETLRQNGATEDAIRAYVSLLLRHSACRVL